MKKDRLIAWISYLAAIALVLAILTLLFSCNPVKQLQKMKQPIIVVSSKEGSKWIEPGMVVKDSTGKWHGLWWNHNLNSIIEEFVPGDTIPVDK